MFLNCQNCELSHECNQKLTQCPYCGSSMIGFSSFTYYGKSLNLSMDGLYGQDIYSSEYDKECNAM